MARIRSDPFPQNLFVWYQDGNNNTYFTFDGTTLSLVMKVGGSAQTLQTWG